MVNIVPLSAVMTLLVMSLQNNVIDVLAVPNSKILAKRLDLQLHVKRQNSGISGNSGGSANNNNNAGNSNESGNNSNNSGNDSGNSGESKEEESAVQNTIKSSTTAEPTDIISFFESSSTSYEPISFTTTSHELSSSKTKTPEITTTTTPSPPPVPSGYTGPTPTIRNFGEIIFVYLPWIVDGVTTTYVWEFSKPT